MSIKEQSLLRRMEIYLCRPDRSRPVSYLDLKSDCMYYLSPGYGESDFVGQVSSKSLGKIEFIGFNYPSGQSCILTAATTDFDSCAIYEVRGGR